MSVQHSAIKDGLPMHNPQFPTKEHLEKQRSRVAQIARRAVKKTLKEKENDPTPKR